MKLSPKALLAAACLIAITAPQTLRAAAIAFNGSYSTHFNGLGTNGTAMPAGFRAMVIAGANTTFSASTPISTAGIASATASGLQTLTVWSAGTAVASSSTNLFNV